MKKWVDVSRRDVEYIEEDLVLVKLLPHTVQNNGRVYKGLLRRYEGPFPLEKKVGKVAYKLKLPYILRLIPSYEFVETLLLR